MATRTELSLEDAQLAGSEHNEQTLTLTLDPCRLYVAVTGSREETEWRQAARIVLEGVSDLDLPSSDCMLKGGDISAAGFTYRDRIPLPLEDQGEVAVDLLCHSGNQRLTAHGRRIRVELFGERKYLRHVR